MPDQWEEAAKKFKPEQGVVPSASAAPKDDWKLWQSGAQPKSNGAYAEAAPQTVGHGLSEAVSGANPIPGLWQAVRHPLDTAKGMWDAQGDEMRKVGPALQHLRDVAGPRNTFGDRAEAAAGLAQHLIGSVPVVGPAVSGLVDQIGGTRPEFDKYGNVTKQGSQPDPVGGISRAVGTGIVAPLATEGAGMALRSGARPLVRSALGIPSKAEAYGANPAKFVLDRTSGLRPSSIARNAESAIKDLTAEQEAAAARSTTPASLGPARRVVSDKITQAESRNSTATPRQLSPMAEFLHDPQPGFTGATEYPPGSNTPISFRPTTSPILGPTGSPLPGTPTLVPGASPLPIVSEMQSPLTALGMRRQFDTDFIKNWNPQANTKGALGTARRAYHALGQEVDKAIPGGAARDEAIQSGIGARNAAEASSLKPSLGQRVLFRLSRPTGGAVPAAIGYGIGGVPGAAAGLTAAEMAAEPVPMMAAARGTYGVGKALGNPIAPRVAQGGALNRRRQPEGE